MRLSIVILIVGCLHASATSYAQKVTLSEKNASLEKVFKSIKKQTGYVFFYDYAWLSQAKRLDIEVKNAPLKQTLDLCFENQPLTYSFIGKTIVVKPKESAAVPKILQDSLVTVTGTVTDTLNVPISGVSVMASNRSSIATMTDANGRYSISIPKDASLVFSYLGFQTRNAFVGTRNKIDITLNEETTNLTELVIVGYGTQKRTTITGSVSTVSGSELEKSPVANITNSIAGKLAGVSMRPNGGQPGQDNPSIHIRGIGTIGANSPLIVVDGIIRDNINQVDPAIIESVSVLKDAAAVAPYGLGGANGVILINTKKGHSGLPTLTLNSYYGLQTPTYFPNLLDAKDYMRLRNEAYFNEQPEGENMPYPNDLISNYDALNSENPDLYPNSSAKDLVNMHAPLQSHNLQLSGGSEKVRYFTGLGYFKQDGLFNKANYSRFSYTMNLESNVTNTTKVSFSLLGSAERTNDIDAEASSDRLFRGLYKFFPTAPLYYTNGLWGEAAGNSIPAVLNAEGYEKNDGNTLLSTITVEQELPFIKGLSIKGSFSYDSRANNIKGWHTPWYYWTQNTNTTPYTYTKSSAGLEGHTPYTYLRETLQQEKFFTYQGFVNYQRTFGSHQFTGLLVAEARNNKFNTFYARRNNFSVDIDELNMGSSNKIDYDNGGSSSVGSQIGYVYRLGYVYNDKYMLEATGRYDGHYYFAPGERWGYFPAFSIGWRISEENFMKNIKSINNLKVRGSWGKSGNLAGSAYQYLSGYNLVGGKYAFGTGTMVQGAYNPQEANRNITWEVSTKSNIGFEATLWRDLLMIEADYFYERRSGMLLSPAVTVPLEYGLTLAQENAGEMKNQGFELRIGTRHLFHNGLRLALDGNISIAKNRMLQVFETAATYDNPNRRVTGRAFGTPFGYHALGLFTSKDDKNGDGIINGDDGYNVTQFGILHPGDIKYQDISGPNGDMIPDGKIDGNDEVVIGYNPDNPSMTFGFTPTAEWKGIDLSLFFQGSAMTSVDIGTFETIAFENNKSNSDYEYFNNHWSKTNENAKYPIANTSPSANNTQVSDFWFINSSHLRLKTATLGYVLPDGVTQLLKINNIRFYFSGQNLFTFSKLKFKDPETPSRTAVAYPNMKSYSFGVNITL